MKKNRLDSMSNEELTTRFADAALTQYEALLDNDIPKYNRVYDHLVEVRETLRNREPDARPALLSLYGHPNIQVRLQAAKFSIGAAPRRARKLLDEIKAEGEQPQSADARSAIRMLDSGEWKPT